LWNHGGAGDDVQAMAPGHMVSVLTPTSHYGAPFVRYIAAQVERAPLWIFSGVGSFGRQVGAGAAAYGLRLGLHLERSTHAAGLPNLTLAPWDAMCAGSFDEDIALVTQLREAKTPPRLLWAVAAGVKGFGAVIENPDDVYGTAQWIPG